MWLLRTLKHNQDAAYLRLGREELTGVMCDEVFITIEELEAL